MITIAGREISSEPAGIRGKKVAKWFPRFPPAPIERTRACLTARGIGRAGGCFSGSALSSRRLTSTLIVLDVAPVRTRQLGCQRTLPCRRGRDLLCSDGHRSAAFRDVL